MKTIDKHFFSPKLDFIAFSTYIPIVLIYLVLSTFNLDFTQSLPISMMFLGWLLVDGSHVYSTLFITYFDKEAFQESKTKLILTPVLLLAINCLLFYIKPLYFYRFLANLAMFHFIRQEFGWMKIASRLDDQLPDWIARVDRYCSYVMTVAPMALIMTRIDRTWYAKGDLFMIPEWLGNGIFMLLLPAVTIFLGVNIYHTYKTKTFNTAKLLVFINTMVSWYIAKIAGIHPTVAMFIIFMAHGIPYLFIAFKAERVSDKVPFLKKMGAWKYLAMYLFCVGIWLVAAQLHHNKVFRPFKTPGNFTGYFIIALAWTPAMSHFVIDGFIWKRKRKLVNKIG